MTKATTGNPSPQQSGQIFSYFTVLSLVLYLASPSGYLVDFATSYMLKNQLHVSADTVANFRLLTGIPTYCAFIFGLIRDNWSPFGRRDRGFLMIFGPLTAVLFAWLAVAPLSYMGLFIARIMPMNRPM